MPKNIEKFKTDILFMEVHRTERSDKLIDKIEAAERFIRRNKKEVNNKNAWMTVVEEPLIINVFQIIASQILYHKNLLLLIEELKAQQYETDWAVSFNYYYYKGIFESRIKHSKTVLRKLRPFVLEETKHYSYERKLKELEGNIGQFFKGWYVDG